MKKNLTEIVMILDASGSMYCLTKDTIGGFNSMIDKQRNEEGEALVSLVTFNVRSHVQLDRVKIEDVKPLTEKDYEACGGTALYDAVGDAVHHIRNIHKYIREEDVPEHTMFVIITDGMENSSNHHTRSTVRDMVSAQKEAGWEFVFLGANIDAEEAAGSIGIGRESSINFISDEVAMPKVYKAVSRLMSNVRNNVAEECWADEVKADYKARKR